MSVDQSENPNAGESLFGLQKYLIRFIALLTLLLILIPLLPGLISNLAYSFSGEAPKLYWYLSRSAGFVALTILWASMVLGLGLTNKMARLWPGAPAAFAIHEFVSLLGLAFAVYHGLVLIGDHFVDFSLPRLLVPFSIAYETIWVGLGQVAFYIWAIVAATFYVRRSIGQKTWRIIHYTNFAVYVMGVLHGIFSGTDSNSNWVKWYYLASGSILLALLVYRVYDALKKRQFMQVIKQLWQRAAGRLRQTGQQAAEMLNKYRQQAARLHEQIRVHAAERLDNYRRQVAGLHKQITGRWDKDRQQAAGLHTDTEVLDVPAGENQSSTPEDLPVADPIPEVVKEEPPARRIRFTSETFGENKIRVRIPEAAESRQEVEVKQVDGDILLIRWKKDFRVTPPQSAPDQSPKRIIIVEE